MLFVTRLYVRETAAKDVFTATVTAMTKTMTETCPLCDGSGRFNKKSCSICECDGKWEVVVDDNYLAMQVLVNMEGGSDKIVQICNRRIAGITPDNITSVLDHLQTGLVYQQGDEQQRFDGLHKAGAKRWGWAWLNANRFAIELAKLHKADYTKYRYALSSLVFGWLIRDEKD